MSELIFGVLCLFLVGGTDGSQGEKKNNTTVIRYATYHVDQLYQACPPAGKTKVFLNLVIQLL